MTIVNHEALTMLRHKNGTSWTNAEKHLKICKKTIVNHEALTMLRHGNGTSNWTNTKVIRNLLLWFLTDNLSLFLCKAYWRWNWQLSFCLKISGFMAVILYTLAKYCKCSNIFFQSAQMVCTEVCVLSIYFLPWKRTKIPFSHKWNH